MIGDGAMNHGKPRVDVRAVLYTDDLEPITVLELPTLVRDHLERHGVVRLPIMEPPNYVGAPGVPCAEPVRVVEVWAERFVRKGQSHLMLFTRNDENALLLRSAFLPGQRRELNDQRAQAFAKGFVDALTRLGAGE